jgi:hypothetical protein
MSAECIQEQPTHSILHDSIYSDSFSATRLPPPPQESQGKPSEGQTISYRTKPLNPSTTNVARLIPPYLQLVSVQLTGSTKCFPNRRSPPFQRTGWQYQNPNYGTLSHCCRATSCRQHQRQQGKYNAYNRREQTTIRLASGAELCLC